ncbi:MAG: hypothetical protein A4S09_11060 [Proteobacteria bacterium SG_bin7]|nr:MAG: hypothetical protein A4S09_11060 [Proteobacteria bacterium SG_bin7]
MKSLTNRINLFFKPWDDFWFGNKDFYCLSLFRVVFGLILLVMYSFRHIDVSFYFLDSGFLPRDLIHFVLPEFYRPPIMWFPKSDIGIVILHSCYLAGLVVMILGVFGRWFQVLLLAIHLMFIFRNPTVIYGADIVSSFWLFYLCLVDARQNWSILNFFKNKGDTGKLEKARPISDLLNSAAIRLFQIQLCIIYGYTGMEKLKGAPWWEGTALWNVVANSQLALMDFSFVLRWPLVIIIGTYFTLIFEIYFPALVWPKKIRMWVLLAGVLLHIGIAITMGLVFFSAVMVASYILFLESNAVRFRFLKS